MEKLPSGEVDGIMSCNKHDRPYSFKAGVGTLAVMSYVIAKIKSQVKSLFEIDVFWSPIAALALKRLKQRALEFYKRDFFQRIFRKYLDVAYWLPRSILLSKTDKSENIRLFFNINAEFSIQAALRPLSVITKSVIMSFLSDALFKNLEIHCKIHNGELCSFSFANTCPVKPCFTGIVPLWGLDSSNPWTRKGEHPGG